jgi:MOSC domain-containing protein YiiM
MPARVIAVNSCSTHTFSKATAASVTLIAGLGVEGDAHCGATVRHRSRVAHDPTQPNLRQVHLIHSELFDELAAKGFTVSAGQLGENITTAEVDLMGLPAGAELCVGQDAVLRITGLRNPCRQLDGFQAGLMAAVLDRSPDGQLVRKAGVMSVVLVGGVVRPGDEVRVRLPGNPHRPLTPV